MNPIFGRWLPAIAETAVTRWLPAIAAHPAVRRLPAVAETPVARRTALAVAGLTCAAACSAVAGPAGTVAAGGGDHGTQPAAYSQTVRADQPQDGAAQDPSAQDKPADGGKTDEGKTEDGKTEDGKTDDGNSDAKPSRDKLVPHGVQGYQSRIDLDDDQRDNAREIVRTARKLNMGQRGAVIGVATALQESKLRNLGHLGDWNDHDSLGLFQQRPSSGWGSPDQITDRDYSAGAFFDGLRRINNWRDLPLTDAAQAVQVSAYPFAYAQWENQAADIVQDVWSR
ncbi:hypothetical protein I0C86_05295 [Plantactinospora sp. S1510]|uniref:Secreted protein n=1 Tax=Plantactinospora alkalitolerans TaxID=2789879 RepID=A0ABS0GQZ5_9ACTN|nr:hypothetical protein [Plantactinospora alkalitolerans]MBF9128408.1 hypothetical protein [Plantactinospora alkalitolerans]